MCRKNEKEIRNDSKVMDMKERAKRSTIIIYMVLMCFPLVLTLVSFANGKVWDITLKGYAETYDRPIFSMESYKSGEFQTEFVNWWGHNFKPRNIVVKIWNQYRFTLFKANEIGDVVGKDDDLISIGYIDEYICQKDNYNFKNVANQEQMDQFIDDLEYISQQLKNRNKVFLVYSTPNKVDYDFDNLPFRYKVLVNKQGLRAIDYFREKIVDTSVDYLDTNEILQFVQEKSSFPVFYSTGHHISRAAEQMMSQEIIAKVKRKRQDSYGLEILDLQNSAIPYWRDTDLWDMLNVYQKPQETYYKYNTRRSENGEKLNWLVQGGSFAQGLTTDLVENQIGNEKNIFYNQYTVDEDGTMTPFSDWQELDLDSLIDNSDVIVVEVMEQTLNTYNNGYVSYLRETLEKQEGK